MRIMLSHNLTHPRAQHVPNVIHLIISYKTIISPLLSPVKPRYVHSSLFVVRPLLVTYVTTKFIKILLVSPPMKGL